MDFTRWFLKKECCRNAPQCLDVAVRSHSVAVSKKETLSKIAHCSVCWLNRSGITIQPFCTVASVEIVCAYVRFPFICLTITFYVHCAHQLSTFVPSEWRSVLQSWIIIAVSFFSFSFFKSTSINQLLSFRDSSASFPVSCNLSSVVPITSRSWSSGSSLLFLIPLSSVSSSLLNPSLFALSLHLSFVSFFLLSLSFSRFLL